MSESGKGFETFIKIVGIILLLLFIFGDGDTKIAVLYAPMAIGLVLVVYFALKEKIKQDREKRIYNRKRFVENNYPDAYKSYVIRHIENDRAWTDVETNGFMGVSDNKWSIWQEAEACKLAAILARRRNIYSEILRLEHNAPNGLKFWLEKNSLKATWAGVIIDEVGDRLTTDMKNVLDHSDEINRLELFCRIKEEERQWVCSQKAFSAEIGKYVVEGCFKGCGYYPSSVEYDSIDEEGNSTKNSLTIWDVFSTVFYDREDLDLSLFPYIEQNNKIVKELLRDGRHEMSIEKRRIRWGSVLTSFFSTLDGDYTVICVEDYFKREDSDKHEIFKASLFRRTLSDLAKIPVYNFSDIVSDTTIEIKKKVFILYTVEAEGQTKRCCEIFLRTRLKEKPIIVNMTLYKALSHEQMLQRIEKKRKEQELIDSIPSKVDGWEMLPIIGGLRIKYLLDYYPTKVDFEADDDEWNDRWTVWHFKNDSDKTSEKAHQHVLDRVILKFVDILNETFGEESLKYLTLVCIPASTQEKNDARYKEFSERLCRETGMENGFEHIQVTGARVAKHDGGEDEDVNYSFDDSFFNGKRVILLDDIITKGNSMRIAKAILQKQGAKVICGLAVGKTRHERRDNMPEEEYA